ncbi:MAG: (5-formylfuran-3-yl)methyl phosphate synthase [Gemmatimonadales bacterium]
MRLLVSVRSAVEVAAAAAGGADIVDAKEPARGALGPVGLDALRGIYRALPPDLPLSVALGDPADEHALIDAWSLLEVLDGDRPLFVKLGLAHARNTAEARSLLRQATSLADSSPLEPALVPVAYADGVGPRPAMVARLAAEFGAHGVLLDTWHKVGRDLFANLAEPALIAWAMSARESGLLVAVAGSLSAESVVRAARLPVDMVGVRGAACVGGRGGRVEGTRVRVLAEAIDAASVDATVI